MCKVTIWDSRRWKRALARRTEALRRRRWQRRWSEPSLATVEQDLFMSAYIVRKLLDSYKVSDEVESLLIRARQYVPTGRRADIMNWHRIGELYDLSLGEEVSITLRDFCNQLIHSLVFVLAHGEENGGLDGFFVSSDRDSRERLLYFGIDDVVAALLAVANDEIRYWEASRQEDGAWRIKKGSDSCPRTASESTV